MAFCFSGVRTNWCHPHLLPRLLLAPSGTICYGTSKEAGDREWIVAMGADVVFDRNVHIFESRNRVPVGMEGPVLDCGVVQNPPSGIVLKKHLGKHMTCRTQLHDMDMN